MSAETKGLSGGGRLIRVWLRLGRALCIFRVSICRNMRRCPLDFGLIYTNVIFGKAGKNYCFSSA